MPRVTFIDRAGARREIDAPEGLTLLEVCRRFAVDIEGACGGEMACATCHVVVRERWYDRLPEPEPDEEDMLDLAAGLTATSRLGCQVVLTAALDGLEVRLPETGENLWG